jgi:OFA family oxalate/formate antiporter-like MFS transporter
VVFAPLSNWLMQQFQTGTATVGTAEVMTTNFQSVFFILAGVFFVLGIIGCLMIRLPSAEYIKSLNLPAAQTTSVKSYTLKQAVTSVPFWCIFFGLFFINGTWLLIVPYLQDMGMNGGLEAAGAVFTVSFTGITNAGGRLIMAGVSDMIGRPNTTILVAVVTLICALLLTVVAGISFIVIISLIAFCYGSTAGLKRP